jgi:low affinity Fe/Cu permease
MGPFSLERYPQLVINTGTTSSLIMVFLIQATQNRDAEAVHIVRRTTADLRANTTCRSTSKNS